jgi:hypothetical protein
MVLNPASECRLQRFCKRDANQTGRYLKTAKPG